MRNTGGSELERVHDALRPVLDPELGLSIVDLGLVGAIARDHGMLSVELLATTPACPMRETIHEDALQALRDAFPRDAIEVRASALAWSPARMSDGARRALGWS
ncbi:metal-sulfur cluster assembly factor [Sandaracinus amylolyticus]|uniref:metal-sulfur cluster assembly factor n=1 Tax=Sandaracinus amylolyticus TaxID=927083 RepID=UPI001F42ED46|nr:metal-sulfur cluster assembly factor [Sandaracinus amylolyticus]UJR84122.1 Hypothetical protein I5071_61930 [Sandaracinus amylolyticus]